MSLLSALQDLSATHGTEPVYTDEFLARILAFTAKANSELPVINPALNEIVKIAQKRFNIYAGKIPVDTHLVTEAMKQYQESADWVTELKKRFELKPRKKK